MLSTKILTLQNMDPKRSLGGFEPEIFKENGKSSRFGFQVCGVNAKTFS